MSLFSRVAKNTIYQIIGKTLGTVLGLLTIGLMTRYLGQTGYGYFTTAIAFMQFFGVLADFGLQMATTQMISRPGADEKKIFNNIFALRFFSALIFLGLAAVLAWFMPYSLLIKQGITLISLSFLLIAMQSVLVSVFQKKMNMALTAMAEIWGRLILLAGVWLAVAFEKNLLFILGAVIAGNLINFLVLYRAALKYFPIKFAFDKKIWGDILHFSWPLAITISLTLVYFRADTIILSFFRPQNEVGIYGASYKVLEVLIQLPYLFLGLILPLLTNFFTLNKTLFNAILQKSFDFLIIITLPMVAATVVLGEKIMVFVAGPEFAISGAILKILIFATGAIYLGALFGYAIVACEQQKKMVKFYIFDAALALVLYFIFIPRYAYWAAAVITVLTELIIAVSAFYVLKKCAGTSLKLKTAAKALIASLIMTGVLYLIQGQNLAVLILVGLIIYFWGLYWLKGISKATITEMAKYK